MFQNIKYEAFLYRLPHGVKVKWLILLIRTGSSENFKSLVFGVAVNAKKERFGCFPSCSFL